MMVDYGHELLFGSFVTPAAADPARVVELARRHAAITHVNHLRGSIGLEPARPLAVRSG